MNTVWRVYYKISMTIEKTKNENVQGVSHNYLLMPTSDTDFQYDYESKRKKHYSLLETPDVIYLNVSQAFH